MPFLQGLFGPSRDAVWTELAGRLVGRFTSGGLLEGPRVDIDVGEWTVTLDQFVAGKVLHTRLRAPYANPRGLRFRVYPEGFVAGLCKRLGMQDVQIGAPEFDDAWIVQGNDERALRDLFGTSSIRTLLRGAGEVSFQVRGDEGWFGRRHPDGIDELVLTTRGTVRDVARLQVFFALFAETLDRLVALGAAERSDQGFLTT